MKIVAIIQARLKSSRLPAKVMLDLCGKTVLERVIENVEKSSYITDVCVATSTNFADDVIFNRLKEKKVNCFRGHPEDVLKRFYEATKYLKLKQDDIVVRITADCPLHDAHVIDKVIKMFLENDFRYVANLDPPSYPDGLDCEVFSVSELVAAHNNARLMSEREHVTTYIRAHSGKLGCVKNTVDLSNLRWTIDELEDYILINNIYNTLEQNKQYCSLEHVISILEDSPELSHINAKYIRNEGLQKSIDNDYIINEI